MNILWFSRHRPDKSQEEELNRIFKEPVNIVFHKGSISSAIKLKQLMESAECNHIVAILPMNLYQDLMTLGIHNIIRPIMKRNEETDGIISFTFMHYVMLERIEIVSRRL